ncbi:MAG: type I methionyl aminopeptidase [Deltaproteobacteria bacterium]|jgi:methionyl aminopeptidase|nr:type I methionyl aminopeptidase [Deltaproteobacteria bacterium]MBW2565295.1 type I methionyl aminopeptidase [Deltaproteobacteria bacterium]
MVILKSPSEIEKIRQSNVIVAEILEILRQKVEPGTNTLELDQISEELALDRDAKPAFKGYRGYPYSLCASVNQQVVHGFPSKRPLKEGDILSMDFGISYQGYYGDAAVTVPVGKVSPVAQQLMATTKEALFSGIEQAAPGKRLSDISHAIQSRAEAVGFSVVRQFVGHGIGKALHEDPQVPNYGKPGMGIRLKPGMVIAIEPMVNAGGYEVKTLDDGWTTVTKDGSLSAHFEHTVAITEEGPVILSATNGSQ